MAITLSENFAGNLGALQNHVIGTISALAVAAIDIAQICARGPLEDGLASVTGDANADGDQQKALDVRADEIITQALKHSGTAYYASEEQDEVITLNPGGALAVASDPLDGSSNIDTNVSIGTIFAIFPADKDGADANFLRPGTDQIAGGFFVYGPQTSLVVTTGNGTELYVLDRASGRFKLAIAQMKIAPMSKEYAINASNHNHWGAPVRGYIGDCLSGVDGPLGAKQNMRWIGSLVADANRILMRGGVFLYPGDDRKGYAHGRLRLLYECAPVAFIIEQAGGTASTGTARIMDIKVDTLHQRVPLIFGSKETVKIIDSYHAKA